MKKIYFFLAFFILFSTTNAKVKVVSTLKPIADIVKDIGGNKVNSNYIIPPNVSFHLYEYKFSDIEKVSKSDLFIYIGSGEPNIEKLKGIAKGKKLEIGKLRGMYLIKHYEFEGEEGKHHHHDHHHHHRETFHPSVWLDPINALVIAVNIKNLLQKIDPKNKNYYEKRYLKFQNRLVSVYNKWKKNYKKLKNKDFISYHYTWAYLTNRFKLNYLAVIELGHGREPSLKHIIKIIELIKNRGIKSIFVARQFENRKYINLIKKQVNIKVIYLDPFGINRDYINMMNYNLEKIYSGLKN